MVVIDRGTEPYQHTWEAMRAFTDARNRATADELRVVEHESVYTLGQAGKLELVVYTLLDLRRQGFGIRGMVERLESAVIETLTMLGINAQARRDAPGVYVENEKIAALGLRVRHGCTYHGLSLNLDCDLQPWQGINPCGFAGLGVTSVAALGKPIDRDATVNNLVLALQRLLTT